jgi:hypothetical protein
MLKRWCVAGALLAAMFLNWPGRANATPAGLPPDDPIACGGAAPAKGKFSIELGVSSKGITLKFGVESAQPEATPTLDTVMPAFVEHWLSHMGDVLTHPGRAADLQALAGNFPFVRTWTGAETTSSTKPAPKVAEDKRARRLFDLAETQRRLGNHDAARVFYQRVHVTSPTTPLGKLAIERLIELENGLPGGAEEQGVPPTNPESLFRNMRNRTVPLGLVEVSY